MLVVCLHGSISEELDVNINMIKGNALLSKKQRQNSPRSVSQPQHYWHSRLLTALPGALP